MKRYYVTFGAVLLWGCLSVQAQIDDRSRVYDVVTDTATYYLFSNPKPCFDEGEYYWFFTPNNRMVQEYVATDIVTVYGVAITFENDYGPLPVNSVNYHVWLFKNNGIAHAGSHPHYEFLPIDSVTLNRSHPRFCWFNYEDRCNKANNFLAPCYEFYFDTPEQINRMVDTFYVGRSREMSADFSLREYGARYDNSLPGHIYIDGSASQTENDHFVLQDYYTEKRWGWAFPIIGFRCGPIQQFLLDSYTGDSAVVRWHSVEEGSLFNVRLVGEDGSDTTFVTADTTFTFSSLSDSVRYTAMLRKQCHYATSNYDTTVYGTWRSLSFGPIITPPDDDTVGIVQPKGTKLTLVPNPTSGEVLLTSGADLTGIAVYTASGMPFLHLRAGGRTVRIDTSTWPAGTYLLQAITVAGTVTRRLTVVH